MKSLRGLTAALALCAAAAVGCGLGPGKDEGEITLTVSRHYGGEVMYGDRAEHCWNGDPTRPNAISRLRYHQMYAPKIVERILKTAPPGGTFLPCGAHSRTVNVARAWGGKARCSSTISSPSPLAGGGTQFRRQVRDAFRGCTFIDSSPFWHAITRQRAQLASRDVNWEKWPLPIGSALDELLAHNLRVYADWFVGQVAG